MRGRGLGCLTPLGVLAALASLLLVVGVTVARGGVLFSPGPLNAQAGEIKGGVRSHAEIEACGQCHAPFWGPETMADRCMVCHTNVDEEVKTGQGMHGAFLANQEQPFCRGCHTEHRGPEGVLTVLDPETFPHETTGFPLTGAHQDLACSDCHTSGDFTVGLDAACVACHQEPEYHAGLFSTACEDCHTTKAWRPARYDEPHTFPIDHGARFGSTNSCQVCHPTTLQTYTCYECHDPRQVEWEHREEGIFDFQNCVKCHPTGREEEGEFGEDD